MHVHGTWQSRELTELRWHYGEAYHLAASGGGWRAKRRDGKGGWIIADDPEALRDAIRADYRRDPVSRDVRLSRRVPGCFRVHSGYTRESQTVKSNQR